MTSLEWQEAIAKQRFVGVDCKGFRHLVDTEAYPDHMWINYRNFATSSLHYTKQSIDAFFVRLAILHNNYEPIPWREIPPVGDTPSVDKIDSKHETPIGAPVVTGWRPGSRL